MSIPVPTRGTSQLDWARSITRAVNKAFPRAGAGLLQNQTVEGGTVLSVDMARIKREADTIPGGIICMWSGTTPPDGWYICDGNNGTPDLRGRFVVGYSGSGDYTQPGNKSEGGSTAGGTGGAATHGDGTNDHLPHKVNHTHPVCVTTTTADAMQFCLAPGYGCVAVLTCVGVTLNLKCDDLLASPGYWCQAEPGGGSDDGDTSNIEDGASHEADAGENVAWHSSTDNRPPYYVLAYIMKGL